MLLQYLASRKGNNCFNDIDDVRKSADEHRHFIITSMIEGQENLDWVDTPMMRYYESKFPVPMFPICAIKISLTEDAG